MKTSRRRSIVCLAGCWLGLAGAGTSVAPLPAPTGPVLLTVSGRISQHNRGQTAVFDAAMLKALPVSHIRTRSPWKSEVMTFSGPSLKNLLQAVGAQGKSLHLSALDNYEVDLPMGDVARFDPVLSMQVDGKSLTVRTLGPLLLMYPFDAFPELNVSVYVGRSVWQLRRIVVE